MTMNLYPKRDMSRAEFRASLKRNGFKHEFLAWFSDTTGATRVHFSGVFTSKGELRRRQTIGALIRDRDRAVKRGD